MAYTYPYDVTTETGEWRYRTMHVVTVRTTTEGKFEFFDRALLLTAIVSSIVLIRLPTQIVGFIALYCVGLMSKIYKASQAGKLDIAHSLHGFCVRLISAAHSFKSVSSETKTMTRDQVYELLREGFQKQINDGILSKEELERLVHKVMQDLDISGDGVSIDEFINASCSNETVNAQDVANLFDSQRKRGILEKVLSAPLINAKMYELTRLVEGLMTRADLFACPDDEVPVERVPTLSSR